MNNLPRTAILHYTAPPIIGGVEAVIQNHARVFAREGYPLAVIAGRGGQSGLPPEVEYVEIPLVDSKHPEILPVTQQLQEGVVPADFDALTGRLVALLQPVLAGFDRLIVHNIFTKQFNLPLTAALFQLLGRPHIPHMISWVHDIAWTSPSSRPKMHEGYPWDLLRRYDPRIAWVAVSEQRRDELAGLFEIPKEEVQLIYNGVDPFVLLNITPEGQALIERLRLFEADLIVLMPVRVTKLKNIEFAMRVLAELKQRIPNTKLILTGPPDPHEKDSMEYFRGLQALRAELHVEQQMVFVFESGPDPKSGYQVGLDIIGDLMRVADLIFMPSFREGFGMSVLEGGITGVPVFCSPTIPAAIEIGKQDVHLIDIQAPPGETAQQIEQWAQEDAIYDLRKRTRRRFTWQALFERQIVPLLLER